MAGLHRILTSAFPEDSPRTLSLSLMHPAALTYLINKELRAVSG